MKNISMAVFWFALVASLTAQTPNASQSNRKTPVAPSRPAPSTSVPVRRVKIVDLTTSVQGKVFENGTHTIRTESGEQISIVTENNRILEIINLDGHHQNGKPIRIARSVSACTEQLPDPRAGFHWECDDDCSDIGPDRTVACFQVSNGSGDSPGGGDQNPPNPRPPAITGFRPFGGRAGTEIEITGANFVGVSEVKLNGVSAKFSVSQAKTLIFAHVPANATSGPITVTAAGGTATSSGVFKVLK